MAFGSQQWMYASGGFYPHEIGNSARFDTNSYISRTPSSAGNRKTWTWSGWVKRGEISGSGSQTFFQQRADSNNSQQFSIQFRSNDIIRVIEQTSGGGTTYLLDTNAVFRDPSAWYHIVVAYDTTNATAGDRVKLYVNGERQTSFSTANTWPLNNDSSVNNTVRALIGASRPNSSSTISQYYNGYLAEINLVDGQALDATDFGETKSGVWIPKRYSGTYGTNGYYLPFNDAGFLGKDASTVLGSEIVINGNFDTNINNWTAHNGATLALSNNRLSVYESPGADGGAYQAISVESGKTYSIEATVDIGTTAGARVGIEYTLGGRDGVETPSNQGGHFQFTFTPSSTGTVYVRCFIQAPGTAYFDNISVKEITTQGNDFTSTNVLVTDQMLDSPTNNWATLNPVDKSPALSMSEGNLRIAHTSGAGTWDRSKGTMGVSSGKWYWEVLFVSGNYVIHGIDVPETPTATSTYPGSSTESYGYYSADGKIYNNHVASAYGATYSSGDVTGVALDLDAGTLTFYKNGVSQGVAVTGLTEDQYVPTTAVLSSGIAVNNFGQDSSFVGNKTAQGNTDANGRGDFYYAPPTGYLALCTANLPDPVAAINPALDASPQDHFNPVTYTGTGSAANVDVGFQPDWIWFKQRSGTNNHQLYDSVRGTDLALSSNTTASEYDYSQHPNGDLAPSFTSNGFQTPSVVNNGINASGSTYVGWNWKAGGTAVANTDGTIASQVSANTDAGFSIATYTGDGTNGATIGHGLGAVPSMVITKARSNAGEWMVAHESIGVSNLILNQSLQVYNPATQFSGGGLAQLTSSSTFGIVSGSTGPDNSNKNGTDFVAYCFHGVEGFSKFGSYTGNGSTDGPFIYTGFRPAYVMIRRTDVGNSWVIIDAVRDVDNYADKIIWADLSDAEATGAAPGTNIDLLSNGFKNTSTGGSINTSGGTYIYMAFAEMPFKYANAR